MSKFGDPGFHVHAAIGQYLSLLVYHLVSDDVIPFDLPNYAVELRAYLKDLSALIAASNKTIDLSELSGAIDIFEKRAAEIKEAEKRAVALGDQRLIKVINSKYRDFQRGFVSQGGLPSREFYKHVVTAPGIDTGYAAITFPGISEGVQYGQFERAQEWVGRTAKGILRAAEIIRSSRER